MRSALLWDITQRMVDRWQSGSESEIKKWYKEILKKGEKRFQHDSRPLKKCTPVCVCVCVCVRERERDRE